MGFHNTKLREKVRDIDFTNHAINRFAHYSNFLSGQIDVIKDNGVKDFSLFISSRKVQTIDPYNNQTFL